jgi:hypothetical protein
MLKSENFLEMVDLCKLWAKIMRPFSTFKMSNEVENKLNAYRLWNVNLDGYNICVFYTESDIEKSQVKSIQIFSKNLFTLPFHIVFKVGMAMLGNDNTNIFFSFVREGTTVFCWTKVEDENGNSLPLVEEEVEYKNYLGIKFACIIDQH